MAIFTIAMFVYQRVYNVTNFTDAQQIPNQSLGLYIPYIYPLSEVDEIWLRCDAEGPGRGGAPAQRRCAAEEDSAAEIAPGGEGGPTPGEMEGKCGENVGNMWGKCGESHGKTWDLLWGINDTWGTYLGNP